MAFFNIFFKTFGILIGVSTFILILNLSFFLFENSEPEIKLIQGQENSKNIIATLNLNGPIINNINSTFLSDISEYIDPNGVKKNLDLLKKIKPKILIIKINSPGGTVTASSSLEEIFYNFKKETNVEIYFHSSELLASGGYWVATSGDKIFASYGSIIGSIGVSGPSWYYFDRPTSISKGIFGENINTKNGIKVFNQSAGTSKDLYNPFREPTEQELEHLNNLVNEIYNDFIIKVSKNRKIEISTLRNEIGALIYNSNQAKKFFLIDNILNYDDLIKKIIIDKNYDNYKVLSLNNNKNYYFRNLLNFFSIRDITICKKLNNNFVSILPNFLNNC